MRFDSTDLDKDLIKALHAKGFETAFPIQELTLEMGIRGQDIIGQARTGTGKTLGFGLPLLHRIDPDKNHIQALIVAPTRELTAQVAEDLQIGSARGLNVIAVYGGVPIDPQFDALKTAHVVVGTPGRLLDHLNRRTMDLSRVTELVLDEADEMLDMGFLPDVERLMAACPGDRHTSLFSATMAPAIVSLARRYMNSPSFLHAKSDEPQTAELVDQHFFLVHRMDKPRVLARIMQQPGREGCYVFSRTKAMCDRLVTELEDLGVSAIAIHGDLRQATREKHLDKFRDGTASILVATEVAARGLDVDNVTHVVNYDCPDDDKMYLHRIGRTARAGRAGVAVTFAEHNEVDKLNVIRKAVGAHNGELQAIFSTSKELAEIFDLPDETPWEHLGKRPSSSRRGSSGGGSSRGGSSRDGSSRDGSSRGESSRGESSGNDSSNGRSSNGRSSTRSSSSTTRRSSSDRDTNRDSSSRSSARDTSSRDDERGSRSASRSSATSDTTSGRTRTRTRTRVTEDDTSTSTSRSSSSRTRGDDDGRRDDNDQPAPRKRARARARTNRDDDGDSTARRSERKPDGDGGSSRDSSTRDRGSRGGRSRDGDTNRDDRGNAGRDDNRGERSRDGRSGSGRSRSQGGGNSRSQSSGKASGGGRSNSSRSNSSRSSGSSNTSDRSTASSSTRTSADRITRRGDDARGDGAPRHTRRLEVENLP